MVSDGLPVGLEYFREKTLSGLLEELGSEKTLNNGEPGTKLP